MTRRARRRSGLTLLEVMAAVLVLGMVYSVLADAAIRGLRSEGVSRRRLEASLLADRWLADLETQLALGQIPPSGTQEEELDAYKIGVVVQPYDPTPMLEVIAALEKERGVPARSPNSAPKAGTPSGAQPTQPGRAAQPAQPGQAAQPAAPLDPAAQVESLLTPPSSGEEGRLRRIDVWVAWQEGDHEERVQRTTFAFDSSGLESLFPEKGGEEAGGASGCENLEKLSPEEAIRCMQEQLDALGSGSAPNPEGDSQ